MNEEETKALKEKIVNNRKEIHKATQKEALARWTYEENVSISFGYWEFVDEVLFSLEYVFDSWQKLFKTNIVSCIILVFNSWTLCTAFLLTRTFFSSD